MRTRKIIAISTTIPVALYLIVLAWVTLNQRALTYLRNADNTPRVDPATATLGIAKPSEELIDAQDGARIACWYLPAAPGKPTLLYFTGTAGAPARPHPFGFYDRAATAGVGVFVMSYPGYGGSTGTPTEKSIMADADRAWDALIAKGVAPSEIAIYGWSLGTGVAVQLAARHPVRALILEAPYSSMTELGSRNYPYLPVRRIIWDSWDSMRFIGKVHTPLLVMHGEIDTGIPIRLARELFAAANEPKRFIDYPAGGHTDLYRYGAFEAATAFAEHPPAE
jgi:hypothetical protein